MAKSREQYNRERREIYRYLRGQGYSPSEARKLRNRFTLKNVANQANYKITHRHDYNNSKRNASYHLLRELGLSSTSANKFKSATYKVFGLYFDGLMSERHPIITQKFNYPEIPPELTPSLLKYFAKESKELHFNRDIIKEFSIYPPEKVIEHLIRLKRFKQKITDAELLKQFEKNLRQAEDISDYYRNMSEQSTQVVRVY